jgi:hypothetical protein
MQRAVRNWLVKKRARAARRIPGYLTLTGIIRQGKLTLVYVMLANS